MTKIRTNVQSLSGQRHMKKNSSVLESTSRSLSSGSRRAGDDMASWAQAQAMNSAMRSKGQASRNANDAVSIVQVAHGALKEISVMVLRMKELAIQSASDQNGAGERDRIGQEFHGLQKEIDRIAKSTEFNGIKLFMGEEKKFTIHVDADKDSKNKLDVDLSDLAQTVWALGISDVRVDSKMQSHYSLPKLDYALRSVNESTAKLGAMESRFEAAISKLGTDNYNLGKAKSTLSDADIAAETAKNIKAKIQQKSQELTMKYANFDKDAVLKLLE